MKNTMAALKELCKQTTGCTDDDASGNLPSFLLADIGKRLRSRLDLVRFRSVCRSWRSSLPAPARFPLRVPAPPGSESGDRFPYLIAELTFYAVNEKMMLLEEVDQGGVFSASAFKPKRDLFPPSEVGGLSYLSNAYSLRMDLPPRWDCRRKRERVQCPDVLKIVTVSPENPNYGGDVAFVAHLAGSKKLAVLRLSPESSELEWDADFCDSIFEDIVSYEGGVYAVDAWGRVFAMDHESLRMGKVASALCNYDAESENAAAERKLILILVSGDLYLVVDDRSKDGLKFYRLSLPLRKWVEFEDPHREWGDRLLVLGVHCNFGVPRSVLSVYRLFCGWPAYEFVRLVVVGSDEAPAGSRLLREPPWWQQQQHPRLSWL